MQFFKTYLFSESLSILAASDSIINARSILTRVVPFVILWIIANYTYSQALGHLPASETTAVFSSNPAFVCICGWILLRDRFDIIRVCLLI
jgi:drug/metabolite transporter (DMT)-like permease